MVCSTTIASLSPIACMMRSANGPTSHVITN
jgi:hypothetical protein